MMLKPGQPPPPPPPRKAAKPTDTVPEALAPAGEEGAGATMFLGTSPARGGTPAKATPAKGARPKTNIMSPEESANAQKEALEKMAAAAQQVLRTRTRPNAPPPAKKGNKKMWLMVGLGGLLAVGGIVALLMFLLADDAPSPRRKKAASAAPVETAAAVPAEAEKPSAPEEKKASAVPTDEKAAPPPAPKKERASAAGAAAAAAAAAADSETKPEKKAAAAEKKDEGKKSAPGKTYGTLTLNPGPNVPVTYGGSTSKQVGEFKLPLTSENGEIEVGDASTQFKVQLEYAVSGAAVSFKVNSVPWAIASVDGPSRGRTPLADVKVDKKMTVVELKRPGQDTGMTLRLLFKPN
jgi:hypothetical protein